MKRLNKILFVPLFVTILAISLPTMCIAAQPPVNLGTTSTYAILSGEKITNTGITVINGSTGADVGIYPGSEFTGQASVTLSGTLHINDPAAIIAKTDLVAAYDDAAGRTGVTRIESELGGKTLFPGVYDSEDGKFEITGTLTLDAQGDPDGVFVFKTDTTLITASASDINIIGSARFCRIFWKVGSSATLGTNSRFVGHILALQSISVDTGATIQGQLLARNGSVTLDNNTITNGLCATINELKLVTPLATPSVESNSTINGGKLPKTATPFYNILLIGILIISIGVIGFVNKRKYE